MDIFTSPYHFPGKEEKRKLKEKEKLPPPFFSMLCCTRGLSFLLLSFPFPTVRSVSFDSGKVIHPVPALGSNGICIALLLLRPFSRNSGSLYGKESCCCCCIRVALCADAAAQKFLSMPKSWLRACLQIYPLHAHCLGLRYIKI
jgi:hypothetical protein